MLEDKQELLKNNALLDLRKKKKTASAYEKAKRLFFSLAILLGLLIISAAYFLSPYSRIYRITVDGNFYLKDSDIIALSGLSDDSCFLFTIPYLVERKIEEDPLILKAKVTPGDDRLVNISVEENRIIGYGLQAQGNVLILADYTMVELNNDNIYLITKVPIIEGFSMDDLILLEKNLLKCDYDVINEISEIHYYPAMKYQNVQLVMRDGNYIFTSAYGLEILNHYSDIVSSYVSQEKNCYYFEDISGNAYTSACPWQQAKESEEAKQPEEAQSENG